MRAAGHIGLVTATLAAVLVLFVPSGAHAASFGTSAGCQTVHVGPALPPTMHSSYFQLRVRAGEAADEGVIVANPLNHPCRVTLLRAFGQTATNSGDTYPTSTSSTCVETSCWLSGLPVSVTVPARSRRVVPVVVSVPAATRPGQYLAGVVAQPGTAPAAVRRRRNAFGAAVVARVAIGVAVSVPGALRPGLAIPAVKLDRSGAVPVLRIAVRNPGNTWEHPDGGARISVGGTTRTFGVRASTVLAGDSATLPLPVARVPLGRWPTEVVLWYHDHRKKAVWRGWIGYPKPAPKPNAHRVQQVVVQRASQLPRWVEIVILALAALVVGLGFLAFVLYKRRRRDNDDDDRITTRGAGALVAPADVSGD